MGAPVLSTVKRARRTMSGERECMSGSGVGK